MGMIEEIKRMTTELLECLNEGDAATVYEVSEELIALLYAAQIEVDAGPANKTFKELTQEASTGIEYPF